MKDKSISNLKKEISSIGKLSKGEYLINKIIKNIKFDFKDKDLSLFTYEDIINILRSEINKIGLESNLERENLNNFLNLKGNLLNISNGNNIIGIEYIKQYISEKNIYEVLNYIINFDIEKKDIINFLNSVETFNFGLKDIYIDFLSRFTLNELYIEGLVYSGKGNVEIKNTKTLANFHILEKTKFFIDKKEELDNKFITYLSNNGIISKDDINKKVKEYGGISIFLSKIYKEIN